jgi:hypothetical protein
MEAGIGCAAFTSSERFKKIADMEAAIEDACLSQINLAISIQMYYHEPRSFSVKLRRESL